MSNDIPRRAYLHLLTEEELAIHNAILEVEKLDADVRLTDAVMLLQAAKDSVGDYVDGYSAHRRVPATYYISEGVGVIVKEEEKQKMSSNVLTPEEEKTIRNASKYCSLETKQLLAIIQRLVNLPVEPTSANQRFVHSSECTKRLHGESLAGRLKVRWQKGESLYYDNCCRGEYQKEDRPNAH